MLRCYQADYLMVFRQLGLSYKKDTGWQSGNYSGMVAKYFLGDNFDAFIVILSKNLLLNLMLLHSVLSILLGKPPLLSSGSRPDAFSVSQQQTKIDVCTTLAHLFPLLFLSSLLCSLPAFSWSISASLFSCSFFSVIPKAVIFLVVIGIVVSSFADSVVPLKKRLFPYYNFPRTRVSLQPHLTPCFFWERPEHGPSFWMHRSSFPTASPPKKRTWVTPQAIVQGTVSISSWQSQGLPNEREITGELLPKGHTMET